MYAERMWCILALALGDIEVHISIADTVNGSIDGMVYMMVEILVSSICSH